MLFLHCQAHRTLYLQRFHNSLYLAVLAGQMGGKGSDVAYSRSFGNAACHLINVRCCVNENGLVPAGCADVHTEASAGAAA
jgi:hypothetical protein